MKQLNLQYQNRSKTRLGNPENLRIFHKFNLPNHVLPFVKHRGLVLGGYFLTALLITEPQNKKGRLISSLTRYSKVRAMSDGLTTRDLHSERLKNSVLYVWVWLNGLVILRSITNILSFGVYYFKCRDVKAEVCL